MRSTALAGIALVLLARTAGGEDSPSLLELEPAQAAAFPVVAVESAEEPASVAVQGLVLDPVPFVQASLALDTARAAGAIAERERTRVEALARASQNASARDAEAARLAALRARAELADAEARASGLWGREALAQPDLDAFVGRLARSGAALVRLDLAVGEGLAAAPTGGWLVAPGFGAETHRVRILGAAPAVTPGLGGRAWLAALDADAPAIGALATGRAELAGPPTRGVWVPAAAVVWHEGVPCVFVAEGARAFRRRAIALAASAREGFWIGQGLDPGTRLAAAGAQQLLSAQLATQDAGE